MKMSFAATVCCLPQRIVLAIMLFLGVACEYMMRNLLSIAITQIAQKVHSEEQVILGNVCPSDNDTFASDEEGAIEGNYEWSETTQGVILSAFYWGYIVTHIPGGMLVEKFGGHITFLVGIVVTSVLTLLTPASIALGDSTLLIANRVVMGLFQGWLYAATFGLLATWIPLRERTTLSFFVFCGISTGSILATSLSGVLLKNIDGWHWPFYIYGIVGLVWCVLFALFCTKDPESNRFIGADEKSYLRRELGALERDKSLPSPPFRRILTSMPVWAIIVGQTGLDFSFYVVTTDLPKYFADIMRIDVDRNGLYSSLPHILHLFCAMAFGVVSDVCINKGWLSVRNTRRYFTTVGVTGLAVCFIMASYSGCNQLQAILWFSFASGFWSLDNGRINNMDLSPNYAPTIIAIVNGIGSAVGIVTPISIGLLTQNSTMQEWRVVFWMIFGILIGSNLFYFIFADGKVQSWNDPNGFTEEGEKEQRNDTHDNTQQEELKNSNDG